MSMTMRLYRKEMKFLRGPAIGIFVLINFAGWFMMYLEHNFPNYYRSDILSRPSNPSLVSRLLVRPIIHLTSIHQMVYVYAVLFLYVLLYEHLTRTKYQLDALPVRRWKQLAAKFTAMFSWTVIIIVTVLLSGRIHRLIESIMNVRNIPGEHRRMS